MNSGQRQDRSPEPVRQRLAWVSPAVMDLPPLINLTLATGFTSSGDNPGLFRIGRGR